MRLDGSQSMRLESAISAVVQVKIALSEIFADRQNLPDVPSGTPLMVD